MTLDTHSYIVADNSFIPAQHLTQKNTIKTPKGNTTAKTTKSSTPQKTILLRSPNAMLLATPETKIWAKTHTKPFAPTSLETIKNSNEEWVYPIQTLDFPKNPCINIPPYILGLWVSGAIHPNKPTAKLNQKIIQKLPHLQKLAGNYDITSLCLKDKLQEMSLYERHIPDPYIFTTIEDRLKLLQGIIDNTTKKFNYELSTHSPKLAYSLSTLMSSLGLYSEVLKILTKPKNYYFIEFFLPQTFNPQRQWIKIRANEHIKNPLRQTINITLADNDPLLVNNGFFPIQAEIK